jgi:hypothetical protein
LFKHEAFLIFAASFFQAFSMNHFRIKKVNTLTEINQTHMYKEFKGLDLPTIDKDILAFWDKEGIFDKSVEQPSQGKQLYFLRRSSFCQRNAGYSPRHGTYGKRYLCRSNLLMATA